MNLSEFSRVNRERCESPKGFNHALNSWSLSDWITALVGELGEAANVAKKLNRVRDGIPGNKETEAKLREKFARELADTFIYLDLTAQAAGIDLPAVVAAVFNAKSEQIGSPIRLPAPIEPPGEHTPGPWTIEYMDSSRTESGDAGTMVTAFANPDGTEGATVAEVNRWSYGDDPPTAESEANARLIAASPDLLGACERLVAAWDGATSSFDGLAVASADRIEEATERARAAIAKAKAGAA